jgi:hypothetical protein
MISELWTALPDSLQSRVPESAKKPFKKWSELVQIVENFRINRTESFDRADLEKVIAEAVADHDVSITAVDIGAKNAEHLENNFSPLRGAGIWSI